MGKWRVMSDEWRVAGAGCGKSRFLASPGMTIHRSFGWLGMTVQGGLGGLGVGWGWLDMQSGRQGAGLKTGHYMLNEFGARGGHWSVRRWGRLWGAGLKAAATMGVGREEVVVVAIDGGADGAAPAFRAEGV